MKDSWQRKRQILDLLANGDFVSGEVLAAEIGISRAAINKQIDALTQYGVDIFTVKGKGYKLASPVSLIDERRLIEATKQRCFYFDEIDSTNAFMFKHADELQSGDFCVAEYQSAGKGRRGRTWVSPYGSHLYTSLFWRLSQGMNQAMGLSLVIACSLAKVLESFQVQGVGLKWPNDIYLDKRKLAGVLIEMSGQADSDCNLIIGIGLNLSMPSGSDTQIDQPWSDLSAQAELPNKTELVIRLQQQVYDDLCLFEQQGLAAFINRWQQADLFIGKAVTLHLGDKLQQGICRGINEQGAVLIEHDGAIHPYIGGEISLRAE